uniref:Methyltransferase type 11 domain-containing protein n=1 Tax=Oryza barthii TaxID=65489 RepID=A0A0D3F9C8_9ORYZ
MHHGFYDAGEAASMSDHRRAQIRMIEESLAFAAVPDDTEKKPKSVVDVGCGIGGSSRYLANKYGAQCYGITLSPVQAKRGNALAAEQGLSDKFVSELARVAAPGARIIIVTWCHRNLEPSEESLKPDELNLLKRICDAYYLPDWCSPSDYVKIAESLSLEDIRTADWSENVAPFWPAVIKSALTWKGLTSLLRSGWKTIRGAMVMPLMIEGYKKGLIKFTIITCRKPETTR